MSECLFCHDNKVFNSPNQDSTQWELGEQVSLIWLSSPCFELMEKLKCIEHIGDQNFSLNASKLLPVWEL